MYGRFLPSRSIILRLRKPNSAHAIVTNHSRLNLFLGL
jgi:hypothetical protein